MGCGEGEIRSLGAGGRRGPLASSLGLQTSGQPEGTRPPVPPPPPLRDPSSFLGYPLLRRGKTRGRLPQPRGTEPPDLARPLRGGFCRGEPPEQPSAERRGERSLGPVLGRQGAPAPAPARLRSREAVPSGTAASRLAAHSLPFLPREGSFAGPEGTSPAADAPPGREPVPRGTGRDGTGLASSPPAAAALHKPNYPTTTSPVPPSRAISFISYVEINIHYDYWLHLKL